MTPWKLLGYVLTVLLLLILFVSMTLFAGIRNGSDISYTDIEIHGLDGDVKVYRDEFGVPTIVGESLRDILFGQGYEFARDRSFQLEFYRSLINGQMAQLIGPDLVETDIVLRTIGLKRSAEQMLQKLTSEELSLIESYVNGINTYYDNHPHNKPFELEILGSELHRWEVTDTIAMGSIVAFTFAFGGLNDEIAMVKAIEKVGMAKALEIHPVDHISAYNYLSNITDIYYPNQDQGLSLSGNNNDIIQALEAILGSPHTELIQGYMSNNWVVSAEKSATGNPLIANDPHTSWGAQGIWHRVNLMTTDGEILLQGFNFPGTPLLGFGHNKHVAWAVTSGILDAVDLYYLKSNATHYLYNGTEWKAFITFDEEITVNGGKKEIYTVRQTIYGPIIDTELGEYAIQWTLNQNFQRDNPIKSLIGFNLAESIEDMHNALEYLLSGFNWVFATVEGDIAYQNSGFIPDRKEGYGLIPKNGSAPNQGWNGLIPYEKQLFVINPENGYFATANERVDDRELFFIAESYAPRHRDDRIEQVLANSTDFDANPNGFTLEDMQRLQQDVKTLVAEDLLDPVIPLFQEYQDQTTSSLTKEAIALLIDWDHDLTINSRAGLIFSTYRLFIIDTVFRDELDDLVDSYYKGTRVLSEWYAKDLDTTWFDDITTMEIENKEDMAIRALDRTVGYLEEKFGDDTSNWEWGDKHRAILPHTFSGLTNLFDIGGQPAGGSGNTINAIAGPIWNGGEIQYTSTYGPYFRLTSEVESSWSNIWVVVSSGASGNPLSPHYRDSYEQWINYDYQRWYSSLEYIMDNYEQTAIFRRK